MRFEYDCGYLSLNIFVNSHDILVFFRYDEMTQKFDVEYIAGGNSSFALLFDHFGLYMCISMICDIFFISFPFSGATQNSIKVAQVKDNFALFSCTCF